MKRCNCGLDYPHATTKECSINIEEDYNEFCRSHPEADIELKIPAILKNIKIVLDDSIPEGVAYIESDARS